MKTFSFLFATLPEFLFGRGLLAGEDLASDATFLFRLVRPPEALEAVSDSPSPSRRSRDMLTVRWAWPVLLGAGERLAREEVLCLTLDMVCWTRREDELLLERDLLLEDWNRDKKIFSL